MNFRFFKNGQGSISVRSVALGVSLVFSGVLFVNYASSESKVISMKDNQIFSSIVTAKNKDTKINKCVKIIVYLALILVCVSWVAFILLAFINNRNSDTIDENAQADQDTGNPKDPATNHQPEQELTPRSDNSPNVGFGAKTQEVVLYAAGGIAATIVATYSLSKAIRSNNLSTANLGSESIHRSTDDAEVVKKASEVHENNEEDKVEPQESSDDQVATDGTEVVLREVSDNSENSKE